MAKSEFILKFSKLRKMRSVAIILVFAMLFSSSISCWATTDYSLGTINPAIVPDPLVYNFSLCTEKYGFCSCELIGAGVDSSVYDTDSDNQLSFIEMRDARRNGFFSDEQLGDETFLACHYDPPSPGPYEQTRCQEIFGADDCVCVSGRGLYYGQCYSKSIIQFSPEPVAVPEAFCSHRTVGGFDNCLCDESELDAYLGGDINCYVPPKETGNTWDCLGDSLRIFSGSKYTCRVQDGTVFRPECCPGDNGCIINEYDSGLGDLSLAMVGADMALSAYTAYAGYAAVQEAGTASVANMAGQLASKAGSEGLGAAAETWSGWAEGGMSANPALGALSTALFWVGLALMVYNMLSGMYMTCKPGEYELVCKAEAGLCIYTGKECVSDGPLGCNKEVKVWMCYSSQISKIVNEYGLPQIYNPNCHTEDCDASISTASCGCRAAYTTDGKPMNTRHKGFSVDEFQRLDFGQIPISETLVKTMLGDMSMEDMDFKDATNLIDPSTMLKEEVEGSPEDQSPDPSTGGDTGNQQYNGGCTYNADGSVKWPIEASDFQIIDHAGKSPVTSYTNICIATPIDKPGQIFGVMMYQGIPQANRLLLADPSSANDSTGALASCNNCYIADGWGDIGTFAIGGILKAGIFQPGSNCMDPVHLDAHFYDTNSCLNDSYIYKQLSFVKNTVSDNKQTITLPSGNWFADTVTSGGVVAPNTSYHDYWVYWLPESDIKRGEWIAVDDKCILMDNEAENRTLCGESYQSCFEACGNNDLCKQTCADDHSACIVGDLTWMSPPLPSPKSLCRHHGKGGIHFSRARRILQVRLYRQRGAPGV